MPIRRILSALQPAPETRTPPAPRPKRLVMIAGFQRSGTTALSETLATDPDVVLKGEDAGNEFYDDYYLRPEPEIRQHLEKLEGTVVLKPVRESERRNPSEIAEEYRAYDLTIVWLYRDPVNVYRSWEERGWMNPALQPRGFIGFWVRRNRACLEVLQALGERLLIVRYEDLTAHPACVDALGKRLGLNVRSTLRPDRGAGDRRLAPEFAEAITTGCAPVLAKLDAARSVLPPH